MIFRARRILTAGALAVAAVAAPLTIAVTSGSSHTTEAAPCLAWYGNKEDGICLGYSNGNPTNVGTPFGTFGPNGNSGISTGPLLPGQTWRQPIS
ncbi:hypothetical protein [Mycolicibacterium sp.]|uniref:DUF7155 family protein n=1 Tax=Mycolicibacterium sp. TaxID=2320850 RepID=UPI001A1C7336|nr:hypothetical protein [Mycolicibacterium sp.]MBJ7341007.1 hypothetical protein [Mycolicibacterium sp.]